LQVELDAFSGRPNPHWELTGREATEFAARLRKLAPSAVAPMSDGLGYRGFIVRGSADLPGDFREVRLLRGAVTVAREDKVVAYSDPDRSLELWLLDTARPHVDEAVVQYVGREIGL